MEAEAGELTSLAVSGGTMSGRRSLHGILLQVPVTDSSLPCTESQLHPVARPAFMHHPRGKLPPVTTPVCALGAR